MVGAAGSTPNSACRKGRKAAAWRVTLVACVRTQRGRVSGCGRIVIAGCPPAGGSARRTGGTGGAGRTRRRGRLRGAVLGRTLIRRGTRGICEPPGDSSDRRLRCAAAPPAPVAG